MLFMVIERFSKQNLQPMADRFKQHGRMLPEGVTYVASWMEINGTSCYQIMDVVDYPALERWLSRWSDLVEFEVIEVLPSQEYWAKQNPHRNGA